MENTADITIIGAGVIGLAVAFQLSKFYNNIYVIERNSGFGQETSSRNSEVIHSGIYYPKNSFKAKFCVRGKKLLYDLCSHADIPHRKCGKLIVATEPEEIDQLRILKNKAEINGVHDLNYLNSEEVKIIEPHIYSRAALFSPSTGIIDSHILMKYLEKESISCGVQFVYQSKLTELVKKGDHYSLGVVDSNAEKFQFQSSVVINCAGLESDTVSSLLGIHESKYKIHFCKGEYFSVAPPKNKLVNHLIYPVPFKKLVGLGIHSTIDMGGRLKLGPNAIFLSGKNYDYTVNEANKRLFYEATSKFLPFLEYEDLHSDYAGIRAKIQGPNDSVKDFVIRNEADKGFPNFINLIGIESPGLTSCLAIAEYVAEIISA